MNRTLLPRPALHCLTLWSVIALATPALAQRTPAPSRGDVARDSAVYVAVLERQYDTTGFVVRKTWRDTSLVVTIDAQEPDSGTIAEAEAALAAALRLPPTSIVPALGRWGKTAWVNADQTVATHDGETDIRIVASLSRIGYSRDHHWAAVLFRSACNALCGGVDLVLLEHGPAGWRVYRTRRLVSY
ncbi:MAG TPA: hypothetical protein VFK13_08535 [Gemmatimonadaceae bacterium]|nr:hypothetical protein [Gemmatimonadaceae bacterium]